METTDRHRNPWICAARYVGGVALYFASLTLIVLPPLLILLFMNVYEFIDSSRVAALKRPLVSVGLPESVLASVRLDPSGRLISPDGLTEAQVATLAAVQRTVADNAASTRRDQFVIVLAPLALVALGLWGKRISGRWLDCEAAHERVARSLAPPPAIATSAPTPSTAEGPECSSS